MRDVFIFNIRNGEIRKQQCMETLAPVDYLHFAVVRERGETMYNIVDRAYQSSGEISLTPGDRIPGEVNLQGTSRKSH